jgi:hypothetical protein
MKCQRYLINKSKKGRTSALGVKGKEGEESTLEKLQK